MRSRVNFEIFGPAEDAAYWKSCQDLIANLPPNIRVHWHGETSNDGVVAAMATTDLFFLPTAGENFGHAIFEALSTGVPVLISDQTPWRDLAAASAGWDLPLADMDRWVEAIETFAAWPSERRARIQAGRGRSRAPLVPRKRSRRTQRQNACRVHGSRDVSQARRLAVVVSHPIQYYVTLYRALARSPSLDIKVFFASRIGLDETFDREMNVNVAWATDLTAGYDHEFLPEADRIREIGFRSVDNPSVGSALGRFRPDAVVIHGYAMLTTLRALVWCRIHGVKAILASDSSSHGSPPGPSSMGEAGGCSASAASVRRGLDDERPRRGASGKPLLSALAHVPHPDDDRRRFLARAREAALDAFTEALGAGLERGRFRFALCRQVASAKAYARRARGPGAIAGPGAGSRRSTLLIGGDGEERDMLRAYVAEHALDVQFLGFVNIDGLPALYSAADVFVHSAEIEQYGMVALEAAVLGLPMISQRSRRRDWTDFDCAR